VNGNKILTIIQFSHHKNLNTPHYVNFDFVEMLESRRILEFTTVPFNERKMNIFSTIPLRAYKNKCRRLENKPQNENLDYRKLSIGIKASHESITRRFTPPC
jgi:hypothetical protein